MSMENLGPYTNFHELNQDWFLNEFNKVLEQWKAMQKNFDSLQDAFNDLKSYVQDYFKNLDVQKEINNKLDEMSKNGEISNLLAPLVQGYSMPYFVNSIDELKDPTKIYVLNTNGHVYSYKNSEWVDSGYVYGTNNLFFQSGARITSSSQLKSLGDALPNRCYQIGIDAPDTLPDFPEKADHYGNLITFNYIAGNDAMVQIFADSSGRLFMRNHWGSEWFDWIEVIKSTELFFKPGGRITSSSQLKSLGDALPNRCYQIGIDAPDTLPDFPEKADHYGNLITFNYIAGNDAMVQIFADSSGRLFMRNHWGVKWFDWIEVNKIKLDWKNVPVEPTNLYWCFNSFGIIGDSLASGAEQNPYDGNKWEFPIETRWGQYLKQDSGREVKYFSEGGLTTRTWFTSQNGYPLAKQSANLCQCYLIGLGENDVNNLGSNYLGSISDINDVNPDNNADTYYGNYGKIIQKMKSLVPNARFFIMTNPYNETGVRLQYNNAVREIANHFDNCYLLDLANEYRAEFNDPGFIANSRVGGHYDASAYLYMGKLITRNMNKIIYDNASKFYGVHFIKTN